MSLSIDNLSFSRDERCLFDNITAILQPGQWCDVRGANGSGKSTLLRVLAGLIKPDNGHVTLPPFHYIGHALGLQPTLTVFEQIDWQSALLNEKIKKDALHDAIDLVGLTSMKNAFTTQLSAGQQRRLRFAILHLIPRPLWILDEPYTALDVSAQHVLHSLIEAHLQKKNRAIIATHHAMKINIPPAHTIQLEGQSCY